MSILAKPTDSLLLIINPAPECFNQLDYSSRMQLSAQFAHLTQAAEEAQIPRYFANTQEGEIDKSWLSKSLQNSKHHVFQCETNRPIWSNDELLNSVKEEQREQLFICGFWLDDVVTATALEALTIGFNTHVIVDLSLASRPTQRQSALDRLNQYTVAPIQLRGLLYEWMAKADNDQMRDELEQIWQKQVRFEDMSLSA